MLLAKAGMDPAAQVTPFTVHGSHQMPWSALFSSTVKANVSPVTGCTASAPLNMGHAAEPGVPGEVGHIASDRMPPPGWSASRVQVMPSEEP